MDVTLSPRARAVVAWIAAAAGVVILFEAAHALRPFVWAIITAYVLHPLVASIHRRTRLPKHLITGWLYVLIGLVLVILLINLTPPLLRQVEQLQQEKIPDVVGDIERWFDERTRQNQRFAGIDTDFFAERLEALGQQAADLLGTEAVPLLLSTFTVAIELFVYVIASFYLIVYGDRFVQAIRDLMNRRYHREFDRLMLDINTTLGAYLRGQLILVVIMSSASYAALRILDVDYALSVAIATGFLELIPLIGPWTAGAIAVTIALFQDGAPFGWSNPTLAVVVGLTYFALRQLEDAFVIPLVIGRIVHLHPLLVIFVLVVGTTLGGVLGLILAVPIAAVLKIIVSFFYAKLMAREQRHVELVRERNDLLRLEERYERLLNATVVLLIEPNALRWEDLSLVQRVADGARDHAIDLSAVTPDGVAGALATAAGITTATIPTTLPVAMEPALSGGR
jgi:predicted PurR-regulated permease PerM